MDSKLFMINSLHRHFEGIYSPPLAYRAAPPATTPDRRAEQRFVCEYPARIISLDRSISVDGTMVNISTVGTRVEAAYPQRGPSIVILHELANSELYECEVRWNSGKAVGLHFVDVFGPCRRRQFFAGHKARGSAARLKLVT